MTTLRLAKVSRLVLTQYYCSAGVCLGVTVTATLPLPPAVGHDRTSLSTPSCCYPMADHCTRLMPACNVPLESGVDLLSIKIA